MLHVIIALAGIFIATYSLVNPSRQIIIADWVLIAATAISGTVLVIMEPTRMLHACTVGFAYIILASALALLAQARYKTLAKQSVQL